MQKYNRQIWNISNCPSMAKSWKFGVYTLSEVVIIRNFKIWFIKKDDIDKCKECELRVYVQASLSGIHKR